MSHPTRHTRRMNLKSISVTGPLTHDNLSFFLLRGGDALDGSRFLPLDEALERKCVIVHETGDVGHLEIENLSEASRKLLDAAVLEAIAEAPSQPKAQTAPVTADAIRSWLGEADLSPLSNQQEVPPRVRVETRRSKTSVLFDTRDHASNDAVLHRNLITQEIISQCTAEVE
jgi:hypothetical protein